jgi:hypothetical protein
MDNDSEIRELRYKVAYLQGQMKVLVITVNGLIIAVGALFFWMLLR